MSNEINLIERLVVIYFLFCTFFEEQAPFYWKFGTGGTMLLGNFVRRLIGFLSLTKPMLAVDRFHFLIHPIPGGLIT